MTLPVPLEPTLSIQDAARADYAVICALNLADVQHTSPMDEQRLENLAELACYFKVARVADKLSGFVLAMCSGARYENDNFAWFSQRFPRFIYIDRVVVSPEFRGLRVGARLYEDLFRFARENGIPRVTCEYNIWPSNEASRSFHDKFGFTERGTQWVANGSKRVSLQVADTPS
jgi:predicted GNAT superfamily acetyltransferase